jgi:hypothetical protein
MTRNLKLACTRDLLVVVLTVWSAMSTGCSTDGAEEHQSNLKGLAAYYGQYQAKNRGQLPPNEKAFKDFIAADLSAAGGTITADKIDAMFISNRDDKPFVIRYSTDKSWQFPQLIAYEQEGRNGIRHVGYALGGVEAVSEERFTRPTVPSTAQK